MAFQAPICYKLLAAAFHLLLCGAYCHRCVSLVTIYPHILSLFRQYVGWHVCFGCLQAWWLEGVHVMLLLLLLIVSLLVVHVAVAVPAAVNVTAVAAVSVTAVAAVAAAVSI